MDGRLCGWRAERLRRLGALPDRAALEFPKYVLTGAPPRLAEGQGAGLPAPIYKICVWTRLKLEVNDPGIQAMCRIEFAEYRAMQPFIRPDGAEFRAAEHRTFPLGHLDPPHAANAHVVPRTEPAISGSLATSRGRRKGAPPLPRANGYRVTRLR